jgi:hypothetical protein
MRTHARPRLPISKWLLAGALVSVAALAGACSSGGRATDIDAVQCTWPSTLNDAGPGGCQAARAYITCSGPSGGVLCLSDGALTCPNVTDESCHDACAANQFAVACGSIDPSVPSADPPAGCTSAGFTPAGIGFYCCPCG